jgi:hypothetical protein
VEERERERERAKGDRGEKKESCSLSCANRGEREGLKRQQKKKNDVAHLFLFFFWFIGHILQWAY